MDHATSGSACSAHPTAPTPIQSRQLTLVPYSGDTFTILWPGGSAQVERVTLMSSFSGRLLLAGYNQNFLVLFGPRGGNGISVIGDAPGEHSRSFEVLLESQRVWLPAEVLESTWAGRWLLFPYPHYGVSPLTHLWEDCKCYFQKVFGGFCKQ
ncbi:hypothetical protein B0H63DRAFT_221997 [Podospora didyma]|uniref:Uncharacterized protein n=1 Tax=Podospora didyma TaxID=330526 RepID=A0AAE0KJ61_9PEZI|nr:hypothetical protein B0H63DRAFT_221997 [Podospora didyma]